MLGVLEAEVVGDLGHRLAGGGQRDGLDGRCGGESGSGYSGSADPGEGNDGKIRMTRIPRPHGSEIG